MSADPEAAADQTHMAKTVHASCVACDGKAVLILGPSGSGKSALALDLMSRGADLVADDRTCLSRIDGTLRATAPSTISGLIEARGIGLIRVPYQTDVGVKLAVDLGQLELDRLPPRRTTTLLGLTIPLLHGIKGAHITPALILALSAQLLAP